MSLPEKGKNSILRGILRLICSLQHSWVTVQSSVPPVPVKSCYSYSVTLQGCW